MGGWWEVRESRLTWRLALLTKIEPGRTARRTAGTNEWLYQRPLPVPVV